MASTYSNLKFELIGTGDQSGAWGTTTNTNLGTAIEQALVGMATISSGFVTNSLTLTLTDTNAAQNARALVLNLTQALSGAGTLNVPAIQKPYMIINATGQTVTVKVTGLTGVAVPNGTRAFLYNNGTDVGEFFNYHSSLTLGTALPVASGGTGSSTACGARTNLGLGTIATQPASNVNISGGSITGITDLAVADGGTGASSAPVARTNLGATTVGGNLFTLTNPSAITFVRINADNTVSALPAACFRTAIGAGTGSGSVTSVSGTGTVQGLSLSGTVTGSGNITLGGSLSAVSLTTQVSGTLPVANGGTGAATFTANNVLLGNGTSAFQVVAAGTSGNVLTSNGTTWTSAAAGGGANIQSFTATGTYTKPPGAKFVYVELWGGGGGGKAGNALMNPPGGCTNGSASGGGGGSGGGYTYRMFAAPVVGATETVTIGAGGAGGTAATAPCPTGPGGLGTNGGTTNFGTLLFAGGGTTCGGGAVVAGSLCYRQNNVAPGPGSAYTPSVAEIQIIGGPASNVSIPLANLSLCYTKRELGGMWSGGGGGPIRCPSSLVPTPGPFYPEVGKGRNSMFGAGGGGGGATKSGGGCPSTTLTSGGTGGAGRIYGTNAASTSVSTGGSGGPSPGGAGSAGSCFNGGGGGASAVITPTITTAGAGGAGGAGGGGGGGGGGAVASFTPPGTKRAGAGGAGGNGLAVVYTW